MHAFDVLGDPIRRRILELLATVSARPAISAPSSRQSSGSPNQLSRSTCGCCANTASQPCGPTALDASTRSTRPRSRRSTTGSRPIAGSGCSGWTHWRPRSRAASARGERARSPPTPKGRETQMSTQADTAAVGACEVRRRPHASLRCAARRRLRCVVERGAAAPLVRAGQYPAVSFRVDFRPGGSSSSACAGRTARRRARAASISRSFVPNGS